MDALILEQTEELANSIAGEAKTIEDLNGELKSLMKSALEQKLGAELSVHLTDEKAAAVAQPRSDEGAPRRGRNRRNGSRPKSVPGDLGKIAIESPRDRDGTIEPQLVPKHQLRLAGFDEKILALYVKGMTTRDIQQIVKDLYGVEVSPTLVAIEAESVEARVARQGTGVEHECSD